MRPLERWLDTQGPEEAELRMALLDARDGPSQAQVELVAQRVAERAATLEALRQVPRARSRLAWQLVVGVGVSVMLGALLWPGVEREASPRVTPPPHESAPRPTVVATPTPSMPALAVAADSAPPTGAVRAHERKPRARLRPASRADVSAPDEVPLLQEARRALLAHPGAALALAHQHRALFPRGMFSEERASIEIEALWRLARFREARQAWDQFARSHPHSPYRQRLARLFSEAAQEL